MKNNHFLIFILCSIFFFGTAGCERTDLQNSISNDLVKITPRTPCEECPNLTDCCCFVLLQNLNETADLTICGTTDGAGSCQGSQVGSCASFSGGEQSFELNSIIPRHGFCMVPGQAFWVRNNDTGNANIYISCQGDQSSPQILTITIPGNSTLYIGTNGECEIEECE